MIHRYTPRITHIIVTPQLHVRPQVHGAFSSRVWFTVRSPGTFPGFTEQIDVGLWYKYKCLMVALFWPSSRPGTQLLGGCRSSSPPQRCGIKRISQMT